MNSNGSTPRRSVWGAVSILILAGGGAYWYFKGPAAYQPANPSLSAAQPSTGGEQGDDTSAESEPPASLREASVGDVRKYCAACHAFPAPNTFPRWAWQKQVHNGFGFGGKSKLKLSPPIEEEVVRYYESRAPRVMPTPKIVNALGPSPVRFARVGYAAPKALEAMLSVQAQPTLPPPAQPQFDEVQATPPKPQSAHAVFPSAANVSLGHLFHKSKLDIVVCDTKYGVMVLQPYEKSPALRLVAKQPEPDHTEIADLNGDGIQDILVANLGEFFPSDQKLGSVVWLKGSRDGKFTPITLLKGVGRVTDVQMADFNRDGKQDLIVAVFGAGSEGEIVYLENRTRQWSHPSFVPHILDTRAGTINVPVCDLNHDGKPDFVALISQEHETVVAFLNQGHGRFLKKTLFAGPHPAYGSSGIQMADINGDGRLDVLYSNGDVLDRPHMIRPDHSIQWLENRGTFPFTHHTLTHMPGVERAVAADLNGDGLLDIVGVSFLPVDFFDRPDSWDMDAVVWLEQTSPGKFVRHSLEKRSCDHTTCAVGDVDGDGRPDLVTGNLYLGSSFVDLHASRNEIVIWKNLGAHAAIQRRGQQDAETE